MNDGINNHAALQSDSFPMDVISVEELGERLQAIRPRRVMSTGRRRERKLLRRGNHVAARPSARPA
jgi:hypothetical protein